MPKLKQPLTSKSVDSLKRGQEFADGALPGLRVRRDSTGQLNWSLFIVVPTLGTKRRFEVGHDLSLADAREKARELRRQVREGNDPVAEQKAARQRSLEARDGVGTLELVVDTYYGKGPGASLRTGAQQKKTIARVFAAALKRHAGDVKRVDVQLLADSYQSATVASAAIGALRPIMKWAAKRGLVRTDGWRDLERPEIYLDDKKPGRRKLSPNELATLWPNLDGPYADASKFMLYTAVRLREATEATWSEINLENATWTIAAARRKDTRSKRRVRAAPAADHVVPLSRQVLTLLSEIYQRRQPKPGDLVFVNRDGGALVNWSRWLRSIHKISGVESWSAHALRRTAATMAAETGAEPHVVQAILGHRAIGGVLQSLYQQSRYLPEHAAALQRLADRIDAIVMSVDNIVALRHAG